MRELYTFAEAVRKYFDGDVESLRQAIEFRDLRALMRVTARGTQVDDSEGAPARGHTKLAKWWGISADDATHGLSGYFYLNDGFALRLIDDQFVGERNVYFYTNRECQPFDAFSVWIDDVLVPESLWFSAADLDALMAEPERVQIKPVKLRADREENLLRVIAGLWALSGLPAEHNTTADKVSGLFDSWGWDKPAKSSMADTILKQAANLPGARIRTSD